MTRFRTWLIVLALASPLLATRSAPAAGDLDELLDQARNAHTHEL